MRGDGEVFQGSLSPLRDSSWWRNLIPECEVLSGSSAAPDCMEEGKAWDDLHSPPQCFFPFFTPQVGRPLLGRASLFPRHGHCSNWLCTCSPLCWAEDSWVGQAARAELGIVLHPLLPPSGRACGCHRQSPRLLTFLPWTKKGPSQRPDWFPGREMGHFRKGLAAEHFRAVST